MTSQDLLSRLHSVILHHIIEKGFAPDAGGLATQLELEPRIVEQALLDLADYHGAVLHPGTSRLWVIHPFSLAPTLFHLHNQSGSWWSSCAWCALGAASLIQEDVTITTYLGAEGQQADLHVRDGHLMEMDYLVHFPVPMEKAWENVIYTCSTILLFDREKAIETWSLHHGIPKGDVQPVSKVWEFAQLWYGRHLDTNWTKWTTDEAQAIFKRFGFTHPIWDLSATGKRF